VRGGQKRRDVEQLGERGAFLRRKLAAEAVRIQFRLTLRWRHLSQIAEGMRNYAAAVCRKHTQLLHGASKLLSFGRAETLNGLVPLNQTAALLRRHVVQLAQPVPQILLGLGWKLAKPRLVLQGTLLLCGRQMAVSIHPLVEMFLSLPSCWPTPSLTLERAHRPQPEPAVRALSRESRRGGRKHENHQCWLKHAPEFH
jgi:hypothetical protein